MQATARRLSVVSATSCARRRLIRDVRPTQHVHTMRLPTIAAILLLAVTPAIAADDPLLDYLTSVTFYSSGSEIAPELVAQLKKACSPTRTVELRKATLFESGFDRKIQVRRKHKEGPDTFKPAIGPQPKGFLFTIRLFDNPPVSATHDRVKAPRIDKVFVDTEQGRKWGGGLFPTKDGSKFYSIHLESGLEVKDELFTQVIGIVTAYAKK